MARHQKTQDIIDAARAILEAHHPMTVRQVYYRLVAAQVIDNTRSRYQAVSKAVVAARQEGTIPWEWIEDRLRRPRAVSMWKDVADFAETARHAYRRDVWATQPRLVEVWLEKDALSGIFEDVLEPYGVTLHVGRGYDGWDSLYNAASHYTGWQGPVTILYFGDFDPSGRDMVRSLGERLSFFETSPEIIICAILRSDIDEYNLPPDFTKPTDSRRKGFVARHGDMAVELDALPVDVLQDRIRQQVETRMDLNALARTREQERRDRQVIMKLLEAA